MEQDPTPTAATRDYIADLFSTLTTLSDEAVAAAEERGRANKFDLDRGDVTFVNRERRLEEEYAFKASISISLTPYRELIYQILEKDGATDDGTYTNFVIDSVRNIFTSPTEKIFDSPKRFEGVSEKSLKATAELIGTAVKAAK